MPTDSGSVDSNDAPGEFHCDEADDILTKVQRSKSSVPPTNKKLLSNTPGEGETASVARSGEEVGLPLFLHMKTPANVMLDEKSASQVHDPLRLSQQYEPYQGRHAER